MKYLCFLLVNPKENPDSTAQEEPLPHRYVLLCPEELSVRRVFKENGFQIMPCDSFAKYEHQELKPVPILVTCTRQTVDLTCDRSDYTLMHQLFPLMGFYNESDFHDSLSERGVSASSENSIKCLLSANQYSVVETLLHYVVRIRHRALFEMLLKHGANINGTTEKGYTALHSAVETGNAEFVRLLLEKHAEVNMEAVDKHTPLHLAIKARHAEIVRLLLENGAEINAETVEKWTPLHFAIETGNAELVRLLLEKGAKVNGVTTSDGETPLHLAVKHEDSENRIVQHLLEFGADVFAKDTDDRMPVYYNIWYSDILRISLEKGVSVDVELKVLEIPLLHALRYRWWELAEYILSLRPNPSLPGNREAFREALCGKEEEHRNLAEMMHQQGFTLSADIADSWTIAGAIKKGLVGVIRQLLDLNMSSDFLTNTLAVAFIHNQEDIIRLLLEHGTPVDYYCVKNSSGEWLKILSATNARQAFFWEALVELELNVLESYLEEGLSPNSPVYNFKGSKKNANAMRIATMRRTSPEKIDLLVKYGGVLNAFDLFESRNDSKSFLDRFPFPESVSASDRKKVVKRVSMYDIWRDKPLIRHLIKMEAVCPEIDALKSIRDSAPLRVLKNKCKLEAKELKEPIGCTHVTFYDILTKTSHQIARYVRNEDIVKAMEPNSITERFPFYSGNLNRRFQLGLEQRILEDKAFVVLTRIFSNVSDVPDDVIRMIMQYLSNRDLIILQRSISL